MSAPGELQEPTLAAGHGPAAAPQDAGSRLVVRHLQKAYGRRKVVKDVSLTVRKGEVVGLLGPNGAGKTTSFYMIVGLIRADGGTISIDGEPIEDMPIHRRSRMACPTCRRKPLFSASSRSRRTSVPCSNCRSTSAAAS